MEHPVDPPAAAPHRRGGPLTAALLAAALLGVGATACGDDADPAPAAATTERPDADVDVEPAPGPASAAAALADSRTAIDVRTVEEYDAGHVDGAERIGLADADFADRVADLDPDAAYVVYCRTGNRSAQAATIMREAGLDVIDGGAFDDMVEAGWPAA